MHALHSLAHRAPPATRTRVRWQPYSSISASASLSIPSRSPYPITPSSSVSSSSPTIHDSSINEQILKDFPFNRNNYAIGLVDQAVKSLSEIWHPQDIPLVFLSSSRAMVSIGPPQQIPKQKPHNLRRNNQLPSPISPSTRPSPPSPVSTPFGKQLSLSHQNISTASDVHDNLVPIKGFVHEVLRRSRTSGCVLQTALCYLEAVRPKIPEIARQEREGGPQAEKPPERIMIATEDELRAELHYDTSPDIRWDSIINTEKCLDDDLMATVRVYDSDLQDASNPIGCSLSQDHDAGPKHQTPNASSISTSPLPSPLLCPRRAFLACLILASKFTQDKCYSNRAWAKLSGLPPREIGRCERALGEALEWRLWVGKPPVTTQTSPTIKRPVVRSQSESSLRSTSTFSVWNQSSPPSTAYPLTTRSSSHGGLRRCATLPPDAFTVSIPEYPSCDKTAGDPTGAIPDTLFDHDMSDQTPPTFTSSITPTPSSFTYASSCSVEMMNSSPSPSTPGLSYSPSSTESSSGDRTIQMSTFLDESMTPFNSSYRGVLNSAMCPWLDHPDGKEPSSMVPHCQHVDKTHPDLDLAPPLIRNFQENLLTHKAPPGLRFDPAWHLWFADTASLSPFGSE